MNIEYRFFQKKDIIDLNLELYSNNENDIFYPEEENTIAILINNKCEALLDCFYEKNCFVITGFEVFSKGKGIGKILINEIKKCEDIKKIELIPTKNSEGFWKKMGFVYIEDNTMEWKKIDN